MNRHFNDLAGATATPVDLAREASFMLGHLLVQPAALCVEAGDWSQRLEPRAMQVLVVLARASPAVVGRVELNVRVWGGRVVGDDAINRAVQMLRRVAAEAPAPVPFRIETVPRVGYRLTAAAADAAVAPAPVAAPTPPARAVPAAAAGDPPETARPGRTGRRAVGWSLAALGVLAALAGWRGVGTRAPAPAAWTIAGSTALDDLPPGARDVALSPDGRRLAYRGHDAQGRNRIFVRAARDGGVGVPVSPEAIDARRPAWSPDGAALAFLAFDTGRPCRLYVFRSGKPVSPAGTCETERDPRLAWSADGTALVFGDAPGINAVHRIGAVRLADGQRTILTSPPGDVMGDDLPAPRGKGLLFQRVFAWADEGWITRDTAGGERVVWRRHGVAGSVAAPMPDGAVAVAWTRAGASGIDFVDADGRLEAQPVALGPVTAISVAGSHLLIETDRTESALARAGGTGSLPAPLATVRGQVFAPVLLADGRLRFPVISAGVARIWERDAAGVVKVWGAFTAARIAGLVPSPDGRLTAALVTGGAGREIVVFDSAGKPVYLWSPHARSLNPAAWARDGRHLIVPAIDGAGFRLFVLDPFDGAPPRDLDLPGFAMVRGHGTALYAVRAGETTGIRELWRLDGRVRRLPFDLTLFDIVNWCVVDEGVWLPDRSDRDHLRLVLRDTNMGRIVRSLAAPGLAGPGMGLAADARGPVYVQTIRDSPEYVLLTSTRISGRDGASPS